MARALRMKAKGLTDSEIGRRVGKDRRSVTYQLRAAADQTIAREGTPEERIACLYAGWPAGSCDADVVFLALLEHGPILAEAFTIAVGPKRMGKFLREEWVRIDGGEARLSDSAMTGRRRAVARAAEGGYP